VARRPRAPSGPESLSEDREAVSGRLMASIGIERVTKRFGGVTAVRDLSLEIADREFVTLLGPSGCGKTTLLRLIAGFMAPDEGVIRVGSAALSTPTGIVPPERRGMGMVFQNYAVWPHKTVYQNVAFGLEVRKVGRAETHARVGRVLELVNLAGLERRYPSQLSGGQQQRVALARSLVVEPGILLLDEPLSNLDAKLRERMRWELKELQRRTGITFVYVTHDQSEAMALSDRIAVMHAGEIMQVGAPRAVYARPVNKVVADFMGLVNLISARVVRTGDEDGLVAIGGEHRVSAAVPPGAVAGEMVQLAIRPENLRLVPTASGDGSGSVPGEVAEVTFLGNLVDCHVTLGDGTRVRVQLDPGQTPEVGQRVAIRFDGRQSSVFS
jgi:iron(III) transport system ATP-binding protein